MAPAVSVDQVIVQPVQPVPAKAGPRATEAQALLGISQSLARAPTQAKQRLVTTAMRLANAESAGLSVEEDEAGKVLLRWQATAGELTRYLHGTMPRDFSPCGTAMDRRSTLVMRNPIRCFAYLAQLHVGIRTAMLVPFMRQGKPVGTLWVVNHASNRTFSTEDQRVLEALATFASALLDAQAPAA